MFANQLHAKLINVIVLSRANAILQIGRISSKSDRSTDSKAFDSSVQQSRVGYAVAMHDRVGHISLPGRLRSIHY